MKPKFRIGQAVKYKDCGGVKILGRVVSVLPGKISSNQIVYVVEFYSQIDATMHANVIWTGHRLVICELFLKAAR